MNKILDFIFSYHIWLFFGLYFIENLDGAVKDPVTGELITPGSAGYEEAALDGSNIFGDISTINEDGTRLKSITDSYPWEASADGENLESEENAGTSNNINIYVSGGNLSEPFYEFFLEFKGLNFFYAFKREGSVIFSKIAIPYNF